jgi:hypothetical protein
VLNSVLSALVALMFYCKSLSSPISIENYASAGEPLVSSWECDTLLKEIKAIYNPVIYPSSGFTSGQGKLLSLGKVPNYH